MNGSHVHDDEFGRHIERLRAALVSQPESLQIPASAKLSAEARARIHRALRDAAHESR